MKRVILLFVLLFFSVLTVIFFKKNIFYMPLFAKHGEVIDQLDGVNIYFNDWKVKSNEVNFASDGYRIGKKYQCVEFVKRYYYEHYNHKIPNVWGDAHDYYNPKLKDGAFNKDRGLVQYTNGSSTKPKKGDLLVYDSGKHGHVAIVSQVSESSIAIMHQNASRLRPTRMKHSLKYENGLWTIDKKILVGWLRLKS